MEILDNLDVPFGFRIEEGMTQWLHPLCNVSTDGLDLFLEGNKMEEAALQERT